MFDIARNTHLAGYAEIFLNFITMFHFRSDYENDPPPDPAGNTVYDTIDLGKSVCFIYP